jgi:DnaJ-class molecular chaperone
MNIEYMSYVEWKRINPIAAEKCDYCNGTGICDCELCGQETHCQECNGAGSYELSGQAYDKQLKLDKKRAERWYQ